MRALAPVDAEAFLQRLAHVIWLAVVFEVLEGADEDVAGLAERVQADGMTTEAGLGLMLFYVVALQCVATVAMLKGESGSSKLSWGLYVAYGLLAYVIAVAVNQIGGLL